MTFIRPPILFGIILLNIALPSLAQYQGGDGSGSFLAVKTQASCPITVYPSIFSGGSESASSLAVLTQTNCSPLVIPAIFAGGEESTSSSSSLNQTSCSPIVYPSVFQGGQENGATSTGVIQSSCSPASYPSIFAGGTEDGSICLHLVQTACNATAYPGIYAGGSENTENGIQINVACAPYADFEGDTLFVCAGDTVHFTDLSLGSPVTWAWAFTGGNPLGSSLQNPDVVYNVPGVYAVTLSITSLVGNSSITKTNYISVGALPTPLIVSAGATTFCEGDSVLLSCSSIYNAYEWNSGQTSQSVYASASGNYTLTVSGSNGCKGVSNTINVVVSSNPVPLISTNGPTTLCDADTLVLTSSPASSYHWMPGNETAQSINITANGTYYVEATYANGCSRLSAPISATFGTSPPTPIVSANGPLTFCDGGSVLLTSSPAVSYNWSPVMGNGQSQLITASGTYFVEVGNGSGCTTISAPVVVTVNPQTPTPVILAGGPSTFCAGGSLMLTAPAATSYLWSPGGEITQSIMVNSSGNYSVLADNGTGCSAVSAPYTVTVNPNPPIPTINPSGPTTFCSGDSVILTSSLAPSYLWSPSAETTQSIIVNSSGTYSIQTENAFGCVSSSAPLLISVNPQTPTPAISAGSSTTFCSGDSVILTSSPAASYQWSPGGETTQSITVYNSGNYFVQTSNGGPCNAFSSPITVSVNTTPIIPSISFSGPTSFCAGDSVILTSSPAGSYSWTPGGESTQSIVVYGSGSYSVSVDNGTSCSSISSAATVTVNPLPVVPIISASGPTSFCSGDSVILTASPAPNYLWSPGSASTQSITVYNSGTWYVETSLGPCTSVSLPVTVNTLASPNIPIITINGTPTLCEGDSVELSCSPADNYSWLPNGENTQSIWVSESGVYYVSVSSINGCSATNTIGTSIIVNPNPTPLINGSNIVCLNTTEGYTIPYVSGNDFYWTVSGANIISGGGTNAIQVQFPDTGWVQIEAVSTNTASGCSGNNSIMVQVLQAPNAYAGEDQAICPGNSLQLHAAGGTNYQWFPSSYLNDPLSANPTCTPIGNITYILQAANGSCTDSDTINISLFPSPTADAGNNHFITSDSCAVLNASGGISYYWSPDYNLSSTTTATPDACPDSSIWYYVQIWDANGCSAFDSVFVDVTLREGGLTFPNTFTPNGDGVNDFWEIDGLSNYPNHTLVVFNRWGNKVFDATPYQNDWEGDCIGKPLPDGTYFFVFDPGDNSPVLKGYLTILR